MSHIFLKTTWGYIRRSPFQALAAVFVLALTFFVTTIVAVLVYSLDSAIEYYETQPQVIAFLKDEADLESISNLQEELSRDTRIKDVVYVSKEEALEIYKNATSDKPLLSELVSPTIFPASLEFSVVDLAFAQQVIDEIDANEIVDEVGFTASFFGDTGNVIEKIRRIGRYIRVGGGAYVSMQLASSFLVLIIIIMMRLSARKKEIEILDLIGATPAFIRSPIILEAVVYATVGVLVGWIFSLLLVLYATPSIISYFGEVPVLPKDTFELISIFGLILVGELIIGFFLAFTGSVVAVSRARRRRR